MPNARRACFSIRSYPTSHFQVIACVGNDSKTRKLGSLWFEAKGRQASFFRLWTTASAAKKEGFFSSYRDGWWKIDLLQQPKEKKVMGTARSYFYVVGSAEYSRCEGYAVYLVGPGRCYLLWAAETERNHHWGTVSNAIYKSAKESQIKLQKVRELLLCNKL